MLSTVLITYWLICKARWLQKGREMCMELFRWFHVCVARPLPFETPLVALLLWWLHVQMQLYFWINGFLHGSHLFRMWPWEHSSSAPVFFIYLWAVILLQSFLFLSMKAWRPFSIHRLVLIWAFWDAVNGLLVRTCSSIVIIFRGAFFSSAFWIWCK